MFDDTGIRNLGIGKIHHRITLVIGGIKDFFLKTNCTIFKFSEAITKILIEFAGIQHFIGNLLPMLAIIKEICIQLNIYAFEQTIYQLIKTTDRYPLETIVEIVIIVNETYWQALDNKGRQFAAFAAPLFLGITFNQYLVDILTYQ